MMNEKMKAAFDAWHHKTWELNGFMPNAAMAASWAIDYLRNQQEPAVEVWQNASGQIALRGPEGDAWDISKYVGAKLYAYPVPLPADPPNEALMEAFDRYQAAKVANQGSGSVFEVSAPNKESNHD